MKLAPAVSGNTINGLDEEKARKPKVVYWATEPSEIPHGEMQKWFYTVDPCLPDFAQERQKRSNIQNMPLPPISAKVAEYIPDVWSEKLDKFVRDNTIKKYGPVREVKKILVVDLDVLNVVVVFLDVLNVVVVFFDVAKVVV